MTALYSWIPAFAGMTVHKTIMRRLTMNTGTKTINKEGT
jgi:hypothetical protein